jgi:hypothetical protein
VEMTVSISAKNNQTAARSVDMWIVRQRLALIVGALTAVALAHGLVYAAVHFDRALPVWSYYGLCQQVLLAVERVWSRAHGWLPLSHIRDFGRFYASAIHIGCPLIGFILFRLISRSRIGWKVWKPLVIVAVCAPLNTLVYMFLDPAMRAPWSEMFLASIVFALMVGSVGALPAIRAQKRETITTGRVLAANPRSASQTSPG